ncbi:hypothetical protein H7U19_00410 [Hyunsoonleella sp. SJ7]|uniref:Uncharacterized protein n=1 Tax=Hyunsoonleella aquatilis TaxID=2762758 RepID=A0A923KKH9_9FLAO|nr:hypothetical protein [Hyunsoonleella aquatilis]MBC3756845.1 hypothetical protein [Hyunsoonleella aquatilis]
MKSSILTSVFIILFGFAINAQVISLVDIIEKTSKEGFRASVKADQYGGSISFNRSYRTNCVGTYNVTWRFDKDISTLQNGESFNITLSCKNCKTPCGYKWKIANVFTSNNVTSIAQYPNYTYNGNISQVSTTAGSSGVHDWYPGHTTHTYTFKYAKKKNAALTAFRFDFAGHQVTYVFQEGPRASGKVNCHTLLGLGKLVYGLEIGAYEGYGWDWMDKTIDYALNHIKASNCLSDSYLKDLKRRMYRAPDTKVFLAEIRSYSQKLDTEATGCNCCASN